MSVYANPGWDVFVQPEQVLYLFKKKFLQLNMQIIIKSVIWFRRFFGTYGTNLDLLELPVPRSTFVPGLATSSVLYLFFSLTLIEFLLFFAVWCLGTRFLSLSCKVNKKSWPKYRHTSTTLLSWWSGIACADNVRIIFKLFYNQIKNVKQFNWL